MRNGSTLLDLLLAVTLAGIIGAIAVPRTRAAIDASLVREESIRLVGALDAARGIGMRFNSNATLRVADSSYEISVVVNGDTLVVWRKPGPGARGVTFTTPDRAIEFGPVGLAVGAANRTMTFTRGATTRRVVISRLGRITD